MSTVKSHHKTPFTLRLRPDLRTELEREAAINRRPLAQEIMLWLVQAWRAAGCHTPVTALGNRLLSLPGPAAPIWK